MAVLKVKEYLQKSNIQFLEVAKSGVSFSVIKVLRIKDNKQFRILFGNIIEDEWMEGDRIMLQHSYITKFMDDLIHVELRDSTFYEDEATGNIITVKDTRKIVEINELP